MPVSSLSLISLLMPGTQAPNQSGPVQTQAEGDLFSAFLLGQINQQNNPELQNRLIAATQSILFQQIPASARLTAEEGAPADVMTADGIPLETASNAQPTQDLPFIENTEREILELMENDPRAAAFLSNVLQLHQLATLSPVAGFDWRQPIELNVMNESTAEGSQAITLALPAQSFRQLQAQIRNLFNLTAGHLKAGGASQNVNLNIPMSETVSGSAVGIPANITAPSLPAAVIQNVLEFQIPAQAIPVAEAAETSGAAPNATPQELILLSQALNGSRPQATPAIVQSEGAVVDLSASIQAPAASGGTAAQQMAADAMPVNQQPIIINSGEAATGEQVPVNPTSATSIVAQNPIQPAAEASVKQVPVMHPASPQLDEVSTQPAADNVKPAPVPIVSEAAPETARIPVSTQPAAITAAQEPAKTAPTPAVAPEPLKPTVEPVIAVQQPERQAAEFEQQILRGVQLAVRAIREVTKAETVSAKPSAAAAASPVTRPSVGLSALVSQIENYYRSSLAIEPARFQNVIRSLGRQLNLENLDIRAADRAFELAQLPEARDALAMGKESLNRTSTIVIDSLRPAVQIPGQPAEAGVLRAQVIEQVRSQLATLQLQRNGLQQATLTLNPPELGRIEVQVEVQSGTRVLTHFITETPLVRDALQQNLADLRSMLQNQGYDVLDLEVDLGAGREAWREAQQESQDSANDGEDFDSAIDLAAGEDSGDSSNGIGESGSKLNVRA